MKEKNKISDEQKKAVAKIEDKVTALRTKRQELEAMLKQLLERQATANEKLQAAAASGDEAAYLAASNELSEISPLIQMKQQQLQLVDGVKIEKSFAEEVWAECQKAYAESFSSCLERYNQLLRQAWSVYLDMAALEAEAAANRDRIADLSGLPADDFKLSPSLREIEKSLIQGKSHLGKAVAGMANAYRTVAIAKGTIDLNTFYRHGMITEAEAEAVLPVVTGI